MADSKKAKKNIFKRFREDLAAAGLETSGEDSLICPLCWQEAGFNSLSLEHVVPGSVGGTRRVLSCESCNNRDGSSLDSQLRNLIRSADAWTGKGTLRGRVSLGDHSAAVNCQIDPQSELKVEIVGKASDPTAVAGIREKMKAGEARKISLSTTSFDPLELNAAIMRAGYLAAYDFFGYRYIAREDVQLIRRKIADRTLDVPDFRTLVIGYDSDPFRPQKTFAVGCGSVNSTDVVAVLARLRSPESDTTVDRAALLPSSAASDGDFFDKMSKYYEKGEAEVKIATLYEQP